MEVIIRDVTIRGETEYIIDSVNTLPSSVQLSLLMKASYNSLLTNPKVVEFNPALSKSIAELKIAVEKFLEDISEQQFQ